jgi:hypothetical protein
MLLLVGAPAIVVARDDTPAVGTLAYVVTRCNWADGRMYADQELRLQRGDEPPVTVVRYVLFDVEQGALTASQQAVVPLVCEYFGQERAGGGAEIAAPINRVILTGDGRHVVYHVSDDDLPIKVKFSLDVPLPAGTDEGFYIADVDGSTPPRFIGSKVSIPASVIDDEDVEGIEGLRRVGWGSVIYASPDGSLVTYADLDDGGGLDGSGNIQVMVLDVDSGVRTQLTHMTTPRCAPTKGRFEVHHPIFLDSRTIQFTRYVARASGEPCDLDEHNYDTEICRVGTDGSRFRCVPAPRADLAFTDDQEKNDPDGVHHVADIPVESDSQLRIAGRRRSVFGLSVGVATEGDRRDISEIFLQQGRDILQVTSFGDSNTRPRFVSRNGRRVFFTTSANPLGTNPAKRCELFSMAPLGTDIRQITRFNWTDGVPPTVDGNRCVDGPPPGCAIGTTKLDPVSGAVVFMSNCDLFGTGVSGEQIFAMWPDGTGVRQLTHAAGCRGLCEFTLTGKGDTRVELPGFLSYAPHSRRP